MLGLPTYKIQISLDDDGTYMNAISLVDAPAVEVGFICFDEQKQLRFTADEYKRCITGCAIWADKPIYRRDADGYEYYVVFDKETIRTIAEKYSKDGLWNSVNLQHNDEQYVDSVIMVETFIKDSERGIAPKGFDDVSDGSLFVTFKVEDDALWEECLNGTALNGFSIECFANLVPVDFKKQEEPKEETFDEWVESFLEKKKFVSENILNTAIESNKIVEAVYDGKAYEAQVFTTGNVNGRNVAVVYVLGERPQWMVWNMSDISEMTVTEANAVDWEPLLEKPAYDVIAKILDDANNVGKTAVTSGSDWESIIMNRRWLIVSYNDEKPNPHTGSRQLYVVAWGTTKRGNECIRVREQYGDSRSVAEGDGDLPGWRLMLTHRIMSIRVPDFIEPWEPSELPSNYNLNGDRSMDSVYAWYH